MIEPGSSSGSGSGSGSAESVGRLGAALRWCFENRQTGQITVAQFPNWPLLAIAATWVLRLLVADGSTVADVATVAATGLWLYWGADELVRGVNPWRRVLGAGVIVWQVVALLGWLTG